MSKHTLLELNLYEGSKPYIFVSYSHKDLPHIEPALQWLSEHGYRIWYDEGIHPGGEWPEIVAEHLRNASVFVPFISDNYMQSQNCVRELHYAVSKSKQFLTIMLGDVKLSPGVEMQLSVSRAIHIDVYSKEEFYNSLYISDVLTPCIENSTKVDNNESSTDLFTKSLKNPESAPSHKKSSAKKVSLGISLLALLIICIGIFLFINRSNTNTAANNSTNNSENLETNDPVKLRELGDLYYYTYGNFDKAKEWYEKAIEAGDFESMASLGELYYYGYGIEKNCDKALELYNQALEAGSIRAHQYLADHYYLGNSGEKDYERAIELYKVAAEHNMEWAICSLGEMYFYGYGVDADKVKGMQLLEQAAEEGVSTAMFRLAEIYYSGDGVEQNHDLALKFAKKAVELGESRAMVIVDACS